ncbi:MAG: aldo/keto reductase [Nitrososphaerota archaeon]|nr:aldo/keto reductase [Nitrososphaerota archaeon]
MEYREFGKTGFRASVVGMGTYYDPLWILLAAVGARRRVGRCIGAIERGLESGMNVIDTAELYKTEPLVARAVAGKKRDEILIATKVSLPYHFSHDGVLKACAKSLDRLQTGYIDLYQIHFPYRMGKIREVMAAMEKLVDEGKVRHIGVSNFSLEQTVQAQEAMNRYELASTQMHYNVAHRDIELDLLAHCQKEKIAVLAYYPLGHGRLARARAGPIDELKKKYDKTPAQLALNWLVSKSAFPIPRASDPSHVAENSQAGGWRLEPSDMERLQSAFA